MPASAAAPISRREFAKAVIDRSIRQALKSVHGKLRRAFVQLLSDVQARSDLLRPSAFEGRATPGMFDRPVKGLLALASHHRQWLRPVDGWEPADSAPWPTFSSLAHHLLANYPVPPVLVSTWLWGLDYPGARWQRYFRPVGLGQSLREVGFPITLTKRMAAELWRVPPDLTLDQALRWAQVKGMGGPDELARAVVGTYLGRYTWCDEFWSTVVRFFVNQPGLDLALVEPIVAYVNAQKYERPSALIGEGVEVALDPPQPDFSVKGRTVASLARQARAWRAAKEEAAARRLFQWGRAPIAEYVAPRDDGRAWAVRQLLDSDALAAEGVAMDHCVATYTSHCLAGRSTIWSIGVEGEGAADRERRATVEVDPTTKQVVQAKARENETPDAESLAVLKAWVEREALAWQPEG